MLGSIQEEILIGQVARHGDGNVCAPLGYRRLWARRTQSLLRRMAQPLERPSTQNDQPRKMFDCGGSNGPGVLQIQGLRISMCHAHNCVCRRCRRLVHTQQNAIAIDEEVGGRKQAPAERCLLVTGHGNREATAGVFLEPVAKLARKEIGQPTKQSSPASRSSSSKARACQIGLFDARSHAGSACF